MNEDNTISKGLPDPEPEPTAPQTLDSGASGKAKGKARITVFITRISSRSLDPDNLTGGVKPLVDQLRYSGLIQDDTQEDINLKVSQEKAQPKRRNKSGD